MAQQFRFKNFIGLWLALCFLLSGCQRNETSYTDKSTYYLLEDSTGQASAKEILQLFRENKFSKQYAHSFNPGFTESNYWLVVNADSTERQTLQLQIGTPQINIIEFYQVQNNVPVKRTVTGDFLPYHSRPETSLDFNFTLPENRSIYLLKIDKKFESLQLTFETKPVNVLWNESTASAMIIGIMTGIIILMLIFGIYLTLITREKVYLYYCLYVACGWLYVLANLGYGYKYLWPDYPWFASRARPVFSLITIVLALQFMEHYTGKASLVWQRRAFNFLKLFTYGLILLFLLPGLSLSGNKIGYYLQSIIPYLVGIMIIILISSLLFKSLQKNTMAVFYLSAIAPLLVLTTFQLLHYSGTVDLSGTFLETYGQATGYVSEAIILTFGLVYRFNSYRNEREHLLVSLNQQQVKYAKAIITTQESERRQIADQLHDVAGSLLSAAKLNLSSVREKKFIVNAEAQTKLMQAEDAVSTISDILRNLSHAISPVMLDKVGFKQSAEKIASIFQSTGKLKVELLVIGFQEEQSGMHEKYSVLYGILYELMNNIVKHAQATHTLIQLIEHDDSVVMIVEDNGKGLKQEIALASTTHGLAAIQSKIHYLNGTLAFDDAEPHGLIVTIEIQKER